MKHFSGWQLKNFCRKWSTLTDDKFITEIISQVLKSDLKDFPSRSDLNLYRRSEKEHTIMLVEIQTLQQKRLIIPIIREDSDFVPGVFTRPKKDGLQRMILNRKK